MQEAGDSHQTLVESPATKAPSDGSQSLDIPGLSSGKSKKRERPDQITVAGKKDQFIEEYTSLQKRECVEKLVHDGGGLANMASVDQLVFKMKQEKTSSVQRCMAAKVLVATAKDDCLQKFVELGGVSILKEWIEEGSKTRSTDPGMKDSENALDEELVVILQALEKLPISPETLKGCSIGKSVKQLRSVRNGEVQKRARKLVDTWRKRVDIEMKQSSLLPAVTSERSQHEDSRSCVSDLGPGKATNAVAVKSGLTPSQEASATMAAQTIMSTPSSPSTLNAALNEDVKRVISPEKDASKKTARLSASSSTSPPTLSPAKRQKHSAAVAYDKDCKDEALNSLDCQKLKEKESKCENINSLVASDTAGRKTNEYRKKLRSGSLTAVPCSTDSHTVTLPSNSVQSRDNTNEKVACSDSNMGDSEQQNGKLSGSKCLEEMAYLSAPVGHEAPDPPDTSNRGAGNKDETATVLHPQDGKADQVNERCLSSQSSCTEIRKIACSKVVSMVEKAISPTSPPHGDTRMYPMLHPLSEKTNDSVNVKEGLVQVSSKSMCSENNYPDECAQKLSPKAEPNPSSASMANIVTERNESANITQFGEIGAVDGEESSCSQSTLQVGQVGGVAATQHDANVRQIPADHHPNHLARHGGSATLDGAVCSESTVVVGNACQGPEKENVIVALSHSCGDDGSKQAVSPSANCNKAGNIKHEPDEVHMRTSESPAVTHSCHDFDLNEGLAMDEFSQDIQPSCGPPLARTSNLVTKVTGTLSAPIAVSAASKGAFIPPLNALCKSDVGWTGSAATSAFRPAEPRHALAKTQPFLASSINEAKHVNSFDLNVADQSSFEDRPLSAGLGMQEAHLDLNNDGKEMQSRISAASCSGTSKHLAVGCPSKRAVLDFDLNEQLDEVPQEQEVLLTSAVRSYGRPTSFRGLSGHVSGGDVASWHSTQGISYPGASVNGPRMELFCSGSASQPTAVGSRQVTPSTIPPQPVSSVVYPQTAPFFGGPPHPTPFPASFAYNPMSVGPDTSFMVSRTMPGMVGSSVGPRSRPETSARPGYVASIDDVRGGNGFYTWGRSPQSMYGNSGATIISYNDAAVGGREHVVNYDGNASFEEQMRLFQQAAVPVTPMKRRDPEFFAGLTKQTTWH